MISNQTLHVAKDLGIALVSIGGDSDQVLAIFLVDNGRLGVQDEGNGKETFDPFDQLVAAVGLRRRSGSTIGRGCLWNESYLQRICTHLGE